MDVCAEPPPPLRASYADDPAEEDALYRADLRLVTDIAVGIAKELAVAAEPTLPEKAESVERIARTVRRNAVTARSLREPPRPAPWPHQAPGQPRRRDWPRTPCGAIDITKVHDEDLDEVDYLHRQGLERVKGPDRPDRPELPEPVGPILMRPLAETLAAIARSHSPHYIPPGNGTANPRQAPAPSRANPDPNTQPGHQRPESNPASNDWPPICDPDTS